MTRAAGARELMDGDDLDAAVLARNLRAIERANARFGGYAPVVREIRACGARSVLDVGCGGGDVGVALARDAARRGAPLALTLLDRSPAMLAIARERAAGIPALTFAVGDALALPYPDGAFDAAVCTLALHHFEPDVAPQVLRELRRVARRAAIVADLRRSRTAYVATWLFAHLLAADRFTRHDAPLSVRRAYTPGEALALARDAGWRAPVVRREPWFRMTLTDAA